MLTQEQQQTIENSLWIVNTALKEQNLQGDEDLKQDAILYMCKCLLKYDETKGIKWNTYAYKSVYLYIKRKHARQVLESSRIVFLDQNPPKADEKQQIKDAKQFLREYKIKHILYHCNEKEREVVMLKLQGYTAKQIADKMGVSHFVIQNIFWRIKARLRKYSNEEKK